MTDLGDAKLYLVAPGDFATDSLGAVIEAGVDIVQLRMKESDDVDVIRQGERFKAVCRSAGFIVNDRSDLARALGADGVHLGQEDVSPAVAREILGPQAIIGRSTHSMDDMSRAIDEHDRGLADYIAVGPVYHTPTHPKRAAVGLELVRYAAANVIFPWFAIGGIDISNVSEVMNAGAKRICVVRAIVDAGDPAAAARELKGALG